MLRIWITCLLLLGATAAQSQILLSENFNTAFPVTWSIVNGGSSAATWQRTTNGLNGQTLDGSQFMICNSDAAGNIPAVLLHEDLVSPAVNAAGFSLLYLEFDHYFRHIGLTDSGHVDVWDGLAWQRIADFASTTGAFSAPAHAQFNISAFANPNLKVRFTYDDNNIWAWYWAIDNVRILAPVPDDVGVSAVVSPQGNGRLLTQSALAANATVEVQVYNYGSTSLSNVPVYVQVDGGAPQGPTLLPGPILPGATQNLVCTATANLAAVGSHRLRAWTAWPQDVYASNDTATIHLRQLPNNPPSFPHCVRFESLIDTVLQSNALGMNGLDEMDYSTNIVGAGRLRTYAGPGFAHGGNRACTLDRSPSGAPDAINYVTLTWNLAQFHVANDALLADLWIMDHGDEVQSHDSIWVRGCDSCNWIDVLSWNQLTGGQNAFYFRTPTLDLTALLAGHGQDFSSSFQLRVGQEDNFGATSLAGSDGMTLDDVCLYRILPINAGATQLLSPPSQGACGDSLTPIAVTVTNFGTSALSNVPLRVEVTGPVNVTLNAMLTGPIPPNGTVTSTVGTINTLAGGTFHIAAYTMVANDSARGDDTLWTDARFSPRLSAPVAQGDTVCIGDSAWVYVPNVAANVRYYWFDSPSNGNLLGIGDSLRVGAQYTANAYYVEPRSNTISHVGPLNNQIGTGADFVSLSEGLVFDAFEDIVIDSVTVYPSDTGIVQLLLTTAAGLRLDSVAVAVAPSFAQAPTVIAVGLPVPQGVGYRLRGSGSTVPGLYRNNAGGSFPYVLPGVVQITGTANALSNYYYFWYDWVVRYDNCPGTRGIATTDTTSLAPVAHFTSTSNGLQATFVNGSQYAHDYRWTFGDGGSSTAASPQYTYTTPGNYNVCLIARSPCGADTFCQTWTVNCLPIQSGFVPMRTGLTLTLTDTTTGILGQAWAFGDGQSAAGSPVSHTYAADGNYVVCLENWNACGDTAIVCDSVQVCAPLVAAIGYAPAGGAGYAYDFEDLSAGGAIYWHWDFGDGGVASVAMPHYSFMGAGPNVVTLIVGNLCGEFDTVVQHIVVVGRADPSFADVRIYPNPTAGNIVVELPVAWTGHVAVQLHDLLGQAVGAWQVQLRDAPLGASRQQMELDLDHRPAGAYWLQLDGDAGHIVLPILVRHP